MDDAQQRPAVLDQRDVDGELALALDELLGAVEGVDQPERPAGNLGNVAGVHRLLGDDRILLANFPADRLQDQLFRPLIGLGHRRGVALARNVEVGGVDLEDRPARAFGDIADGVHHCLLDLDAHLLLPWLPAPP